MLFKETIVILCLVYVLSLNVYNDSQRLQDIVSSYCPYINFCHAVSRQTVDAVQNYSCCAGCSCEDECWKYDTCCPDKENISKHIPGAACKTTLIKQDKDEKALPVLGYKRYRIEDSCPPSEINISLARKCSGAFYNSTDEFVWVSDKVSGKIYQNRYCALCHGVTDFISWLIRTSCLEVLMTDTSNFMDIILSDHCTSVNEATSMEETRARTFACDSPHFSECNVTGFWTKYEESIDKACKWSYWPYFHKLSITRVVQSYRNIFCYICNSPEQKQVSGDYCEVQSIHSERKNFLSFSALIDVKDLLDMNTGRNTRNRCGVNEIWDFYTNQCRELTCPVGKRPNYGVCNDIAVSFNGLCVSSSFYLEVLWNLSSVQNSELQTDDLEELGLRIHEANIRNLGMTKIKCVFCFGVVGLSGSLSRWNGFKFSVTVKTTRDCTLDIVMEKTTLFLGKHIRVHLAGNAVIVLSASLNKFHDDLNKEIIYFRDKRKCVKCIKLNRTNYCPEIDISPLELEQLNDPDLKHNFQSLLKSSGSVKNDTTTVCLDTYFSTMSQNSGYELQDKTVLSVIIQVLVSKFAILLMNNTD